MLKLSLCGYSGVQIHIKGAITVLNTETAAAPNIRNRKIIFKNFVPFTDCISEVNNAQVDNGKDINVVMSKYNLIKYSDIYLETSGSLWQYHSDEPALNNAGDIFVFPNNDDDTNNNSNNNNKEGMYVGTFVRSQDSVGQGFGMNMNQKMQLKTKNSKFYGISPYSVIT